MACSSSHWWQAPLFFTISVVLAFIAITTRLHSNPSNNATPQNRLITHNLSINASKALRKSGFNIIATLFHISPEIFPSSPNRTIFAIKDAAISNTTFPPWLLRDLLQYHTSPFMLSMNDLLKKTQGSCFPTLLHRKNVAVTKVDAKERLVEINHVLISHPNIFLEGNLAIHGVLGPFSSLDPQDVNQGWHYIQSPVCDSSFSVVSDIKDTKRMVEWTRIIRWLSSNGFVSFAVGLHSVLDGILEDHTELNSVTIFAPPDFAFVSSPSPLLDKIVRFHILPTRLTYIELASLPDKKLLRTLAPDQDLQITGVGKSKQGLAISGVEIVATDIFSSKSFVIHGIPRAFEIALPLTTSR
ncbi:Fasciclin domain-containing protein [Cephalotus follicularis]|uniref:Fasciclin domain-containing protein n=1 Tax=Cephalotus follicularis TaxID=3775 RepID=A0A1Q3BT83_CEPFO|nr:Fasciclin domain-containing protein [Cephalotus follicularis]